MGGGRAASLTRDRCRDAVPVAHDVAAAARVVVPVAL
jgi:hypothetical protein